MLRTITNTSAVSRTIDYLLAFTGRPDLLLVKQVMQRQLPDITVYYANQTQGPYKSPGLNALLFHELGHTQHYQQVGNNFWTLYIGHIVGHVGYGDKSDSGSGRIAISEGWGEYTQRLFTQDRYRGTTGNNLAINALDALEYQVPGDNDNQWFIYSMYHDMIDTTIEPTASTRVIDNVTYYFDAGVFRGLQPDVLTVRDYQAKVNAQNGNAQAPQLEQLVTSYRW